MRTRTRVSTATRLLPGLISLILLVMMVCPTVVQAQEMRLRPYNHGRGMKSPVQTPQERGDNTRAVRISGTFGYSLRSGLTLNDRSVRVTVNTAVFPSLRDRRHLPDPSDLAGLKGTVYGRPGINGIEAVLIILQTGTDYRLEVQTLLDRPAPVEGGMQEMPRGTPQ